MTRLPAVLLALLAASVVHAQSGTGAEMDFDRLSWPVDCILGNDCYIQNYMDRAPGPEVRDIGCGPLSYNGHKGTDVALPSIKAFEKGVAVRAAAAGTVRGSRNGMLDILQGSQNAPDVSDRECGNGVAIQQDDGLVALYCHMKQGSVTVSTGQTVVAGDFLGQIGLSGHTMFPHLHFELVQDETPIDPFAPDTEWSGCAPQKALWKHSVSYVPGGLLDAGLSSDIPSYPDVKQGLKTPDTLSDPARLITWSFGYGARAGDVVVFTIAGPEGVILEETKTQEKNRAQFYYYFGKRRSKEGWPSGSYKTTVSILRDDQVLAVREATTRID